MTSIDLAKEIEGIVKDLCKCANKQDKYALEVVDEIRKELEVLERYKKIEEELGIDLIEAKYVLDNANMTVSYTRDGKPIHTDYGYIEDFIIELREALKNEK